MHNHLMLSPPIPSNAFGAPRVMPELSKTQNRVSRGQRPVGRRESIIDTRRVDRVANLEVNSNIRQARRGGDGGAEELRKIFGSVKSGLNSFEQYTQQKFAKDEADYADAGFIDAQTGEVDQEAVAKSESYRIALSRGKTQSSFYAMRQEWAEGLADLVEDQDSESLAERYAEIDSFINQSYAAFVQDEDGNVKDFGHTSNMRWVVSQMQGWRVSANAEMRAAAEQRFNDQIISTTLLTTAESLKAGMPLNLEGAMDGLPPSVDRLKFKQAAIQTVKNVAAELAETDGEKAIQILEALTISRRASKSDTEQVELPASGALPPTNPFVIHGLTGTLSLSPEELADLQSFTRQLRNRIDRQLERNIAQAQSEAAMVISDRLNGLGPAVTEAELRQLRKERKISATTLNISLETMRNRNQAALRDQKSLEARPQVQAELEGQRVALRIMGPVFSGEKGIDEANADLFRLMPGLDPRSAAVAAASVSSMGRGIANLRRNSPEYNSVMAEIDAQRVQSIVLPKIMPGGQNRENVIQHLKAMWDQLNAEVALTAKTKGDIQSVYDRGVRRIDAYRQKAIKDN